jgi:hypothetical protein
MRTFARWRERALAARAPAVVRPRARWLTRWRAAVAARARLAQREEQVRRVRESHTLARAHREWTRQCRLRARRRARAAAARWAVVAVRALTYSRVRRRIDRIRRTLAFRRLAAAYRTVTRTFMAFVLKKWREGVRRERARRSRDGIMLAAAFVRWRMTAERLRLFGLFSSGRVAGERRTLWGAFRKWHRAFGARASAKEAQADRHRRSGLQKRAWAALWRQCREARARVAAFRGRSLIRRGFAALSRNWERLRRTRERRAEEFRDMRLTRFAWTALSLAMLRNRGNPVDREVSAALNQLHGGRYRTRIVYI